MVDYWARSDIHTLGNMGIGGALHAAMAPIATKVSSLSCFRVFLKAELAELNQLVIYLMFLYS